MVTGDTFYYLDSFVGALSYNAAFRNNKRGGPNHHDRTAKKGEHYDNRITIISIILSTQLPKETLIGLIRAKSGHPIGSALHATIYSETRKVYFSKFDSLSTIKSFNTDIVGSESTLET